MTRTSQRWLLAALVAAPTAWAAAPATAFELFGIRLWGSAEEEDVIDIIDPLPFSVDFEVEGGPDDLPGRLRNASSLYSTQGEPASGNGGLLARARGDYRRILAALYDNAYYGGQISIELAGNEAANMTLDTPLPDPVPVVIRVRPGPRFKFGEARIVNDPPPDPQRDDEASRDIQKAFQPGERANAGAIAAASTDAVARWRHLSYAKAREAEQSIVADHATSLLDAVIVLEPGRSANFGRTIVRGTRRVDPGFVAYMADLPEGRHFSPDRVQAAQDRLGRLGVFSSIRIEEAEEIAPDNALDMTVAVEDGPVRTLGFGATLSTIEGLGAETFWEHRNLFGRAERLRFSASVTGFGVVGDATEYDYSAGVNFTRPGVFNPNVDFIASLLAQRLDLDTYRETSITARAGFRRSFARFLNGEATVFATKARYEDFFGTRDFLMLGATARGDYDRRDSDLNPTRGYYLAAELTPFYEFEYGNAAAQGTLEGRVYRSLDDDGRFVLAARAEVGSYVGPSDRESPPDKLFFAGGSGSIRGYAYRSIGIEETNDEGKTGTIGGRSLVEGSLEARFRFGERFGGVTFVDAGYVSPNSTLTTEDADARVGAGVGVRYFTGLGPLRLDVATPVTRRDDDDIVAVYIGIGQAF